MKEKLIRKAYHFQGMLDGMVVFYAIALTVACLQKRNRKNKPLHEQVKERKEIH